MERLRTDSLAWKEPEKGDERRRQPIVASTFPSVWRQCTPDQLRVLAQTLMSALCASATLLAVRATTAEQTLAALELYPPSVPPQSLSSPSQQQQQQHNEDDDDGDEMMAEEDAADITDGGGAAEAIRTRIEVWRRYRIEFRLLNHTVSAKVFFCSHRASSNRLFTDSKRKCVDLYFRLIGGQKEAKDSLSVSMDGRQRKTL